MNKKIIPGAVSSDMLDALDRRENPSPPLSIAEMNEALEKVDPGGKKALAEARRMFDEAEELDDKK